jgi:Mg/Co/Ni transporter MgtE
MFGNIPKETLAELIHFLNENEDFETLKQLGTVSRQELRNALNDLAIQLKKEATASNEAIDLSKLKELKKPYRQILSALSPRETKLLIKGFLS